MGSVSRDTLLKREVALKILSSALAHDPARYGQRFLMITQAGDPKRVRIAVKLNWTAGLEK
jgi:hypothetical protein